MATFTLALVVLYLSLAFGLRGWLQWRRTGDAGFRLGGLRGSAAERVAVLLLVLGLALGLSAPVLEMTGALRAFERLRAPALGLPLTLAGMAGTLRAQLAMGTSWRVGVDPGEHTALRTDGPFRFVRNPIYSFMLLTTAGLALLVPNAASVGALVLLSAGLELQVRRVEEPHLLRSHGAAYAAWAARTGRFLPGVGRLLPRYTGPPD